MPALKIAADQMEDSLVFDPSGRSCHEHIMVDAVEEFLQIHVHYKAIACFHVGAGCLDCIVTSASGAEAVAAFAKVGIEDGREYLQYRLFDEPVEHSGYSEQADSFHPASVFLPEERAQGYTFRSATLPGFAASSF